MAWRAGQRGVLSAALPWTAAAGRNTTAPVSGSWRGVASKRAPDRARPGRSSVLLRPASPAAAGALVPVGSARRASRGALAEALRDARLDHKWDSPGWGELHSAAPRLRVTTGRWRSEWPLARRRGPHVTHAPAPWPSGGGAAVPSCLRRAQVDRTRGAARRPMPSTALQRDGRARDGPRPVHRPARIRKIGGRLPALLHPSVHACSARSLVTAARAQRGRGRSPGRCMSDSGTSSWPRRSPTYARPAGRRARPACPTAHRGDVAARDQDLRASPVRSLGRLRCALDVTDPRTAAARHPLAARAAHPQSPVDDDPGAVRAQMAETVVGD